MARTVVRVVDVLEAVNKKFHFCLIIMIISIGFSGGKDSTVLFHLINEEAKKR
jgi:predicted phosphoadenosine phosphosulfate sulfurtransferase